MFISAISEDSDMCAIRLKTIISFWPKQLAIQSQLGVQPMDHAYIRPPPMLRGTLTVQKRGIFDM